MSDAQPSTYSDTVMAARAAKPQSDSVDNVVIYARDPAEDQDPVLAARNCFPMFNMALSQTNITTTTSYDLKRFPTATREAFEAVDLALMAAIDTTPHYTISLQYCSSEQAKIVRAFASGEHLVGSDPVSHAAQRHALSMGAIIDTV